MAFSKQDIIENMRDKGIVPLFTHDNAQEAQQVVEATYRGGVRAFEFTNRRPNSFEIFTHLVSERRKFPDLMLGIGTVMDADTTKKFIDAGADFIISPILKLEMAEVCRLHNIAWIPGCATLTEIVTAKEHGAAVIKVFPGSVLGPNFVSSILPVVPDLKLMITGGVEPTKENLGAWFKAGAMCVGMGSQLFTKEILQNRKWDMLQEKVAQALAMVKDIRSKS
ncbi:MAG TPA: bifunctional 4-hydroxy-2-oxoglutarate aldolase/2-dehydro-3-deoxy-phosphogluconate aldolase [Chryseosolibacter sp.]|nr:bifunctional 4-hydroxy-2-oxoglutarate aldolase/2-dehydro-3-deoxy-phosphogluconate aldolase [Chryseosolibacter sp.]